MTAHIKLPENAAKIISLLEAAGFCAFVVGGCVRDVLLGRSPGDWDICTDARPQEAIAALQDITVLETGLKHGTVTAIIDHKPIEITTFRLDGDYADHRRPDSVTFTEDLTADLSRRDFTVNAIAYHPDSGPIDPFNGQDDLQNKIIRCVGDPKKRFEEDALRILRALRFSATLGFAIEEGTTAALLELRESLRYVAAERVQAELIKLLCGMDARRVLLEYREIIFSLMPQLKPMDGFDQRTPWHCHDIWGHTCAAVEAIPPEPRLRWAALLHDSGKPSCFVYEKGSGHFHGHPAVSENIARDILGQLKCSRKLTEAVAILIGHHELRILEDCSAKRLKRLLGQFGEEILLDLLELARADVTAQAPEKLYRLEAYEPLREEIIRLAASRACVTRGQLAVNGNDLLQFGLNGPALGRVLDQLLEEVLEGRLENTRESLLDYAARKK